MPALKPIARDKLIKKLRKAGYTGPYSATRHQYMEKETDIIFIPNPHGKDIGKPLLKQIIKQLRITKDEFLQL